MSVDDPLFGMAMRAARMLAPLLRAAEVMAGPVGVSAVWRSRGTKAAAGLPAAATEAVHWPAVRRAERLQDPHPNPLPRVGEGEGKRSEELGRRAKLPVASFPMSLVGEGGAQRRVKEAAVVPSPPRTQTPSASLQTSPPRQAAALLPAPGAARQRVPARTETPPPSPAGKPISPEQIASPPPTPSTPPEPLPPDATHAFDDFRLADWLSAHLAAETRRPARGATGFDPRLSPPWPGTLQGPWGWGG